MDGIRKNYLYLLACGDGSLYTGWTNDLRRRVEAHRTGRGAKYTRVHPPVKLVYYEVWDTRREAMRRETQVKRLSRPKKEALIAAGEPDGQGIPRRIHAGPLAVKTLTRPEMRTICRSLLKDDFPEREQKPASALEELYRAGVYVPCGFFEEGEQKAYGFFVPGAEHPCVLLDYFAVRADLRGAGVGSRCLSVMREFWEKKTIYIESERAEEAVSGTERAVRERRLRFYLRAGAVPTGLFPCVRGTGYTLLALPGASGPDGGRLEEIDELYHLMFPGEQYGRSVRWQPEKTEKKGRAAEGF